jgi:hypothetical protein
VLTSLEDILARVDGGSLVPTDYYRTLDCDAVLDARDSDGEFESAWLALREEIEEAWMFMPVSAAVSDTITRISREVFAAVSQATSQHEIASYVSDDLDLIARGKVLGLSNPLLSWLSEAYDRGHFPTPPWRIPTTA